MRAESGVHQATPGHLACAVLWRAEPQSWSQNLTPVGDTKGSLWRRKLRRTKGRGRGAPGEAGMILCARHPGHSTGAGPSLCLQEHTSQRLPPPAMEWRVHGTKPRCFITGTSAVPGGRKIKLQQTRAERALDRMSCTVAKTEPRPSAPWLTTRWLPWAELINLSGPQFLIGVMGTYTSKGDDEEPVRIHI